MKIPEKRLVQILLQGADRMGSQIENTTTGARLFSTYALENDWNFSSLPVVTHLLDDNEKYPHIRTFRFFQKEKERLDENFLNAFAWEHYKRNLSFHPLVSLSILNSKYEKDILDLVLLNTVGGRRLEYLRACRGGRYKNLYRDYEQAHFIDLDREAAKLLLKKHLARYPEWLNPEEWPKSLAGDAKEWYSAISVLSQKELKGYFSYTVDDWIKIWVKLSDDFPGLVQKRLRQTFKHGDHEILNGLYRHFLEAERDAELGKVNFSILFHGLGKKYVTHLFSKLTEPSILMKRWRSVLNIGLYNYMPWGNEDIMPFIEVYKFLDSKEESAYWVPIWQKVGLSRFSLQSQPDLLARLRKEFKSEVNYEWLPLLDQINEVRKDMISCF